MISDATLLLNDELFNLDVEFVVQESEYNLQRGNIYLNAEITSYRKNQHPLHYHRISSLEYKSSFVVWIKDLVRNIPLINLFCPCSSSQIVTVKVVENFNNFLFRANALRITLSNTSIIFSEAILKVRPALYGIRYLMKNWFMTCGFIFSSLFACMALVSHFAFLYVLRIKIK